MTVKKKGDLKRYKSLAQILTSYESLEEENISLTLLNSQGTRLCPPYLLPHSDFFETVFD